MQIDVKANLRTLRDVLRYAVTCFNEAGLSFGHGQADAYEEAMFLVMRSLSLPLERADVFLDAFLTIAEMNSLLQLIERRVKTRMPVAYLLKEAWLQGQKFYVDNRCIVPRSFLGELLAEELAPWVENPAAVTGVLDLCTGSGCIAVLAAQTFPAARVDAVDLSLDALAVAERNVATYHLRERVRLLGSNLYDALGGCQYDIILSNPPYVTEESMRGLPAEYRHEPVMALAAGADGLDCVRPIVRKAAAHLNPGGLLVVEVGDGRDAVEREFPDLPLTWLTTSAGDDMVFLATREDLLHLDH